MLTRRLHSRRRWAIAETAVCLLMLGFAFYVVPWRWWRDFAITFMHYNDPPGSKVVYPK